MKLNIIEEVQKSFTNENFFKLAHVTQYSSTAEQRIKLYKQFIRKNISHHFPLGKCPFFNPIYVYVPFLHPQSSMEYLGNIEREHWPEMGYNNHG